MAFIRIQEQAEPDSPPAGRVTIYVDSTSGLLSMKDEFGTVSTFGGTTIHASPDKVVMVDADEFAITNSVTGFILNRISLLNLKAVLKTYFDTLYEVLGGSAVFESSGQTVTSAGALTIAHGLGARPRFVTIWLECTVAEFGYNIGDYVLFTAAPTSGTNVGISLRADATNLYIKYGSAAKPLEYERADTGAVAGLTNASWQVRLIAKV